MAEKCYVPNENFVTSYERVPSMKFGNKLSKCKCLLQNDLCQTGLMLVLLVNDNHCIKINISIKGIKSTRDVLVVAANYLQRQFKRKASISVAA